MTIQARRGARRGAILVWAAVLTFVFIGFVGLAMDTGVALLAGSQLQIAADAGALAAAARVREIDQALARQAAVDIAHKNKAAGLPVNLDANDTNAADGDVVVGQYFRFADDYASPPRCPLPPCFFPQTMDANAVRVRARRTHASVGDQVPLIFGAAPLFGVRGVDVTRSATAIRSGGTGAGIITLDPTSECSLDLQGDVVLDVTPAPGWSGDTTIHVDSDDPCALCGKGDSFALIAPMTNVVGSEPGYCFNASPTIDTFINPDSPYVPDPLAYLPAPPIGADYGGIPWRTPPPGNLYPPGYYSGGLRLTGAEEVKLGPGIYVFDGSGNNKGGIQTSGTSSLLADNVLLYIKGGPLQLNGTGQTRITPMTEEINTNPDYIGVSIFQARDNTATATINGTASMDLQGTYYFPTAKLEISGTGGAIGNQIISWQLSLAGSGDFRIQYSGAFPSAGSRVFLVE